MSSRLKVLFAGTPEFAATTLQTLLASEYEVIGCYTQPDRPAGRGRKLTPSPVKTLAQEHHIPVYQPVNFKQAEDVDALSSLGADIMVVVAYGLLLPKSVLDAPRLGCINVHASLLPRWRGAAPIQRAIAAGDSHSGVTIMQMDVGLDTGDMLLKVTTPIIDTDTGGSLHDRLATLGSEALINALDQIANGSQQAQPQDDSQATYAHKLSKEEAKIDWATPATQLHNKIRAFNPWPVAQTTFNDQTVRLWVAEPLDTDTQATPGTLIAVNKDSLDIATGAGALRIHEMQLSGAKRLPVKLILNAKASWFTTGAQFL